MGAPRIANQPAGRPHGRCGRVPRCRARSGRRSEEHTSELQSQSNLVCRLLLEKKKNLFARTLPNIFTTVATARAALSERETCNHSAGTHHTSANRATCFSLFSGLGVSQSPLLSAPHALLTSERRIARPARHSATSLGMTVVGGYDRPISLTGAAPVAPWLEYRAVSR